VVSSQRWQHVDQNERKKLVLTTETSLESASRDTEQTCLEMGQRRWRGQYSTLPLARLGSNPAGRR